jgi:AcrR family transcriptional regulator
MDDAETSSVTVRRRPPGRIKGAKGPLLQRDAVIAAAIRLVEADGPEALSFRKLAAEMGVSPMALYTPFRDKRALVEAIIDALIGELDLSALPKNGWRAWLSAFAHTARELFLRHPGFVRLLTDYPNAGPNALQVGESAYAILLREGIAPSVAVQGFWTIFTYIIGFVGLEGPRGDTESSDPEESRRRRVHEYSALDSGQYPNTVALAQHVADMVSKDQFTAGLNQILDGMQAANIQT